MLRLHLLDPRHIRRAIMITALNAENQLVTGEDALNADVNFTRRMSQAIFKEL